MAPHALKKQLNLKRKNSQQGAAVKTFSATEAKNNFGNVLESIAFEPIAIVKNGKAVAVMISAQEFGLLEHDYAMTKAKAKLIANDHQAIETIIKFSNADISSEEAMRRLGLRFEGQLLDLLGMTNLPFPAISNDRVELMVNKLLLEGQRND